MTPAERYTAFKYSTAAVCTWETIAILTAYLPTVSALCRRHRWLAPLILGGLAKHLYAPKEGS